MGKEDDPRTHSRGPERRQDVRSGRRHERQHPSGLPPELIEAIKDHPYACVTLATADQGTAYVIKAPENEIQSVRGRVPIGVQHELYAHSAAPVIRTVIAIYDQPTRPLALESFINVADPAQRADFASLAEQEKFALLFYDERLAHRLSKRVTNTVPDAIAEVLGQAERLAARIPPERYDFDRAKASVLRVTTL